MGRRHPVAVRADHQAQGAGRHRPVTVQVARQTQGADLQALGVGLRLLPVAPHRGQARRVAAAMRVRARVGRAVKIQQVEVTVPVRATPDLATQRVVTFHFQVSSTKSLPTVAVPRQPMLRVRETQGHKDSREVTPVQAGKARARQPLKPDRAAALPAARALKTVWSPTGVLPTR